MFYESMNPISSLSVTDCIRASLLQWLRHIMPAVQEIQVQFLIPGLGRSLETDMATHSSILAWKIPWTEEHGGLQSMGVTKSWTRLSN